jgi:SAM-dependent methyltransferase
VACGSAALVEVERVATAALAAAWRREDEATGARDVAERRAAEIRSSLPEEIRFDRCTACGLEIAVPPSTWSSDTYPRDQSYPLRWEFQRGVDDLGPTPLDVLEIGCGEGHFLAMAAARGHRGVGIDFSDTVVARSQARGLRVFCAGFDDLARHVGGDTRFDAVALFHVIEHLANPDDLLGALARWTRPGARLLISCPGPRRFTRLIPEQQVGASDFWDYPPTHVLRWTLSALRAVVERHGWRVGTAIEEPFSWVAAGSHIGVVRAIYRGEMDSPLRRRLDIALGWWRLLMAPARRAGISLYVCATLERGQTR